MRNTEGKWGRYLDYKLILGSLSDISVTSFVTTKCEGRKELRFVVEICIFLQLPSWYHQVRKFFRSGRMIFCKQKKVFTLGYRKRFPLVSQSTHKTKCTKTTRIFLS